MINHCIDLLVCILFGNEAVTKITLQLANDRIQLVYKCKQSQESRWCYHRSDVESTFLKSVCSAFIHPHVCKVFHAGVPNYFRESFNYMNDNI